MTQLHQTIEVSLGDRSYPIDIGAGNLAAAGRFLAARCPGVWHAIIITDSHVEPLYAKVVGQQLAADLDEVDVLVVEAGEGSKSAEVAESLWEQMLELGADRKSVVVALGGGVVGDLAGFAAATYARGLRFVQIPTTLLAQVDSSVGGKVGINLSGAKNMVGAFWQPAGVLIDTNVLNTLPEREYISGLAEVVKYGVILDAEFFAFLEVNIAKLLDRDAATLCQVVARCCRLKADVVETDERETGGARAVLNYGHTFAHALETTLGYGRLLHGEAVSIGMECAARLAARLGRVDAEFVARQRILLSGLKLPIAAPADADSNALLAAMARDKKSESGHLRFILPSRMGHVELVSDVADADVLAAMKAS